MFSTILTIKKHPEMTMQEFRKYYEARHIPLMAQLVHARPELYRRAYLLDADPIARQLTTGRGDPEDNEIAVITEIGFSDRAAAKRLATEFLNPEVLRTILDDERKFIAEGGVHWTVADVRG